MSVHLGWLLVPVGVSDCSNDVWNVGHCQRVCFRITRCRSHYLKRTGKIAKDERIKKMEDLPQPVQQALQSLQKVAFDGLVKDKIVFTLDDLPNMNRDDPTCYGLLQSVECYCSDEIGIPTKSFNFLHLGIQEYFAAKYVASLQVHSLLKESFLGKSDKSVRLSNMWIMYCGITSGQCNSLRHYLLTYKQDDNKGDNEVIIKNDGSIPRTGPSEVNQQGSTSDQEISDILSISKDILKDPVKVLYLFQCFQEAQDSKLCDILSKSFDSGEIDISSNQLLPHQVGSLGFFLSRSCRKWKELNMFRCRIGDPGINLLHRYIFGNKYEITIIDLSDNDLTGASSPLIGDIIHYLQPYILDLGNNNITSVRDISTAVINTNTVKVLYMWGGGLTAQEASAISDMMMCLEKLVIRENKLSDEGAVIISEGIASTNTLKKLDIAANNITETGAEAIAEGLIYNTSLEVLDMNSNIIGEDGAIAIVKAIANNETLKELILYGYNMSAIAKNRKLFHKTKMDLTLVLEADDLVKKEVEHINRLRRTCNIQKLEVKYDLF